MFKVQGLLRRGAGVVERDGLENRCAFTGTVGSNPTLSATSIPEWALSLRHFPPQASIAAGTSIS